MRSKAQRNHKKMVTSNRKHSYLQSVLEMAVNIRNAISSLRLGRPKEKCKFIICSIRLFLVRQSYNCRVTNFMGLFDFVTITTTTTATTTTIIIHLWRNLPSFGIHKVLSLSQLLFSCLKQQNLYQPHFNITGYSR